jgi:hypothetical protein
MRWPGRWGWLLLAVVVVAAGVGAGLAVTESSGGAPLPPARARVYLNVDACLLSGPRGVSAAPDSVAWAGMEDASLATRARVSYLAVTGPVTEANALPFLGSLLVRGCQVIVAADAVERAAALADARQFPRVRFIVSGPGIAGPAADSRGQNVTTLTAGSLATREVYAAAVESAVQAGGG